MENERRSGVRYVFELQLEGRLSLTVHGQPMPILETHDVSPFGIGLLVDGHVTNGLDVVLRYIHGTSNIEVSGLVVWNSITESESHKSTVGIYFCEQDMEKSVEFFNAITA